jgi:DNA-binding transcriptional LysR family regulator
LNDPEKVAVGKLAEVLQNRYEIAIVTGPVSTTLYTAVYLFSADFYILTSVEHPLASKDAVSFADFLKEWMSEIKREG